MAPVCLSASFACLAAAFLPTAETGPKNADHGSQVARNAAPQACACPATSDHAINTKGTGSNGGRQATAPAAAPAPAPMVKAAAAPEPLNPAAN